MPTAAEQDLADLKDLVRRQNAARQALHEAVVGHDEAGVREGLCAVADGLLLPIEGAWAEQRLKVIVADNEESRQREAAAATLAQATASANADELERAIGVAQQGGWVSEEDITTAELRLFSLRTQERRQLQEDAAWREVQKAIEEGSVKQLMEVLGRSESVLPPERMLAAQRKIPVMQARSDLRREITAAMREPVDVQRLQHLLFTARQSCLPPAEVAAAEKVLREVQARRRQAAEAQREAGKKAAAVTPPEVQTAPASSGAQARHLREADAEKSPSRTAARPPAKVPTTPLEEAVTSGDRAEIQAAVAALRASGLAARDIHRLHTRAMADFGHR